MKRFKMLPSGDEVSGETFTEVVRAMADMKMEPVKDLGNYRVSTARRVHEQFGHTIETQTNRGFVLDLVTHGLMEQL